MSGYVGGLYDCDWGRGEEGDVVLEALHWYIMRATPCFAKRGGAKKEALGVFLCRDVGICNSKELRNEKDDDGCVYLRGGYSF